MALKFRRFAQHLVQTWSTMIMLYTTSRRMGWRHHILHFFTCFIISLIISTSLFLCLRCSLKYDMVVSGGMAGTVAMTATTLLFFSKRIRCIGVLFLISCGLSQGRNLLITAGTTVVFLWNVRNTFDNFRDLAGSMMCNLNEKRITIHDTVFQKYIDILKWVGAQPAMNVDLFKSTLTFDNKMESQKLEERLREAQASLNERAQSVIDTVSVVSAVTQKVFPALGFVLLAVFAVLYLRRYFFDKWFENTFITSRFVQYDEKQKAEGRPHVLPLTKKEARRYIRIPSARFRVREAKTTVKFFIPVLTHFLIWVLLISIDALFYWLIMIIRSYLEESEPFRIPLEMNVKENNLLGGDSRATENFSFSLNLFEKKCLPKPNLLLYETLLLLSVILSVLVVLGLLSAKLMQLKLLVSAQFYGDNEDERVEQLHAKILRRRSKTKLGALKSTLMSFGTKMSFWCPIFLRKRMEDDTKMKSHFEEEVNFWSLDRP